MATAPYMAILARQPERGGISAFAWCGAMIGSTLLWIPALALVRAGLG